VRIRIDLAYDGTEFKGWAVQPGLRTVQGTLEAALATALRVTSAPVTCAGRTDTGVHARGQVAHVDVSRDDLADSAGRSTDPPLEALARRLNGILPLDVRVRRVSEAAPGFDARFSAVWRRYAYRIADSAETVDPLTRSHVLAWPRPLDISAMNEAAGHLVGEHDFAAFCKKREGATTIRTLFELSWSREASPEKASEVSSDVARDLSGDPDVAPDVARHVACDVARDVARHVAPDVAPDVSGDPAGRVVATVRADAFCHHMVRSLVGCLIAVGEGRRSPRWAHELLRAGARDPAVAVVPPHGLTLEEVGYPPDGELAGQAEGARRVRTLD